MFDDDAGCIELRILWSVTVLSFVEFPVPVVLKLCKDFTGCCCALNEPSNPLDATEECHCTDDIGISPGLGCMEIAGCRVLILSCSVAEGTARIDPKMLSAGLAEARPLPATD